MSATGKKGVKRKIHKTIEFKYQAITEVEKNARPQTEIAKELGISTSTLSTWLSNKESIKKGYLDFGPKRKSMKTAKWEELEAALLKWFSNAREQGAIISGSILMEKADQFAEKLGITDFEAKAGWLTRFKGRYGISFKSVCGESKSVDETSNDLLTWKSTLQCILQKYEADDVYNADETGIFYKLLPDKTLEYRTVDCHGGKRSKERLTVLVCANMSGTDKLPLLIIGKSVKPRCFKNRKTLPTPYTANKKAWMTSAIFSDWLRNLDTKMKRKGRKIVMIIDNCPAHPKLEKLECIELVFLPKNTTSKTQPMDQGVINNLKVHYRKRIVVQQIQAIDTKTELSISVLDAMRFLRESWECVTQSTIQNCFRHAGFFRESDPTNSPPLMVEENDDDDELDDIPLARLMMLGNAQRPVTDFVMFDEQIPTSEQLSDDQIVTSVLEERNQEPQPQEEEDDDDDIPETPPPTVEAALDLLKNLTDFYECSDEAEEELVMVRKLQRKMIRRKMNSQCSKRQVSILKFFREEVNSNE